MDLERQALPLVGTEPICVSDWPAARVAGQLLASLGAPLAPAAGELALARHGVGVTATPTDTAADWARSGAMWLTGTPEGDPLHCTGAPATLARGAALAIELLTASRGTRVRVDGGALLGERAALVGGTRRGQVSVGGSARIVCTSDAKFALSLSRPDDLDLIPALVEKEFDGDAWQAISAWAITRSLQEVADRLTLLDLPFGFVPPKPDGPHVLSPWRFHQKGPAAKPGRSRPLVVNLGSLWAAPLCAHLLGLAGAEIIHVESPDRPDGARLGTPSFYELLHDGHQRVELMLGQSKGRADLVDLVQSCDVLITASRKDALERLGLTPALNGPHVWARITAHGFDERRVGFGDDVAVSAGLVALQGDAVLFAGDAIADPLAGLTAAVAVLGCLESPDDWIVDVDLKSSASAALILGATHGTVLPLPPRIAERSVEDVDHSSAST